MKLKAFNTTNTEFNRSFAPKIRICANSASQLNGQAVEDLKVKAGDKITLHQDEDSPEDWFLEIGTKDGFPLRKAGNGKKLSMAFNASTACRKVIESIGLDVKAISCNLIVKPVKSGKQFLYPIITSSAKNQED